MMRLKQQREGGNSAISKASKTSMNREYYSDYLPEDPQHGQRNGRAVNPLEGEEEEEDLAIREEFGTSTGTGNESFWSKRERLAKEMTEFGIAGQKGRRGEWTEEEREEPPNMVMIVEEETGSLCEQCRTEEEEKSVRKKEADEAAEKLSQKLSQHVTQMNRAEVERQKRREKEERAELARTLQEAQKRDKKRLEEEENEKRRMRRRRLVEEEEEEEERQRTIRQREANKKSEEEGGRSRRGKWKGGRKATTAMDEAIRNGGSRKAESDPGRAQMLREQLRRNEALKKSIDRLEQFKQKQEEEDNRAKEEWTKWAKRRAMSERHSSSSPRPPIIGRHSQGRRMRDFSVNPKVFEAWQRAHEENEEKYRILQEGNGGGWGRKGGRIMETIIRRKRCRRCRKPMEQRKLVRYVTTTESGSQG